MDHSHHLIELLLDLLLFFGISGLAVPLLQRLKFSPVLGYLLCGIIIGPYGFGLFVEEIPWLQAVAINEISTVMTLGELGIIALLFMIGLELSLRRLRELKHYVLGLGSLQIVISTLVIAAVASLFDNTLHAALLLGASLALSSTAIVMQLLDEQHLTNRPVGVLSFSILLMQDLAVVPILIMASVMAGSDDQNVWTVVLHSLLIAVAAVSGIYLIGKRILRPLLNQTCSRNPEWLTAIVVFIVIGAAALTQTAGLSAALGAFLAGLLIAETEFRHEIEVIIEPLKNLLLGIFFLSIGMMIDVREILNNPLWLGASVIGIFALKGAIIYPLARAFGVARDQSARVSIMLAQPGEFAFLILSVAMASQLIPKENGQFFLLLTAVAMVFSPFLFKLAPWVGRMIAGKESAGHSNALPDGQEDHVIIAGFGRIGTMIGAILEKQRIPYVAMDHDAQQVMRWRAQGQNVVYGDSKKIEQWRKLGADHARAVVIAIDEPPVAADVLRTIHRHWPNLPVMMRAKDAASMKSLYCDGAKLVVPEALESSLQLARAVMEEVGIAVEEMDEVIVQSRKVAQLAGE